MLDLSENSFSYLIPTKQRVSKMVTLAMICKTENSSLCLIRYCLPSANCASHLSIRNTSANIVLTEITKETNALLNFPQRTRSEEHTSELQSRQYLVCRLLLEKKK